MILRCNEADFDKLLQQHGAGRPRQMYHKANGMQQARWKATHPQIRPVVEGSNSRILEAVLCCEVLASVRGPVVGGAGVVLLVWGVLTPEALIANHNLVVGVDVTSKVCHASTPCLQDNRVTLSSIPAACSLQKCIDKQT